MPQREVPMIPVERLDAIEDPVMAQQAAQSFANRALRVGDRFVQNGIVYAVTHYKKRRGAFTVVPLGLAVQGTKATTIATIKSDDGSDEGGPIIESVRQIGGLHGSDLLPDDVFQQKVQCPINLEDFAPKVPYQNRFFRNLEQDEACKDPVLHTVACLAATAFWPGGGVPTRMEVLLQEGAETADVHVFARPMDIDEEEVPH